MSPARERCPKLLACPGTGANAEGTGSRPLLSAEFATLPDVPACVGPSIDRLRVIAQGGLRGLGITGLLALPPHTLPRVNRQGVAPPRLG